MGCDMAALMARATGCQPPLGQHGVTILHHVRTLPNRAIRFVLKNPPEKMKQAQTSPRLVRRGNSLDNEGKKMKKLLLATTALVMTAGVAAADVSLSGDAWMGVTYDNKATQKTALKSRARVTFTLSGETDSGMAFGGSFRADQANAGAQNGSAGTVFISGDFGKLSMGDVDSALEATWFRTRHIGVLENAGGSRTAALGTSADPSALYTYAIEGFTVAASVGQLTNVSGAQQYAVGAQYMFDGFGVAVGYEKAGAQKHALISAHAAFDDISVRAFGGQLRETGVANTTQYGADVVASFDGVGVGLRVKRDFDKSNHIGAGVTYGLGGGATLGASVNRVSKSPTATANKTTADMGLAFRF
jgi:outer membrane protein OmpU